MKGFIVSLHIAMVLFAILAISFASLGGIWNSISSALSGIIGSGASNVGSGNNKVTIFIRNSSMYLLGLAGQTVISKNNTAVNLNDGTYVFEVGMTTTKNNTANTTLYNYRLQIRGTTGMIDIRSPTTINILNIGEGNMSITRAG